MNSKESYQAQAWPGHFPAAVGQGEAAAKAAVSVAAGVL